EPRETLLVFGKTPEVNTWRAITSNFNPVELNIQNVSIRNIRSKGVCIQASNKEGLDRLKEAIEENVTSKEILTPKFPIRFRPQIRITGVDPSVTRENVIQKLKGPNELELTEEQVTVRSVFQDRYSGTSTMTLEVEASLFKTLKKKKFVHLGWTRCPVFEYFHTVRCSKCCQYGHTRRFCQSDTKTCAGCGEEHEGRCSRDRKCAACNRSNEKQGTTFSTAHSFYDITCSIYREQIERRTNRTTY
ncbi:unnamed protein product, partial [Ixodes persulcatus]